MNKKKKNKRETQNDITKGKERALAIVSDPDRPTNSMDNANRWFSTSFLWSTARERTRARDRTHIFCIFSMAAACLSFI